MTAEVVTAATLDMLYSAPFSVIRGAYRVVLRWDDDPDAEVTEEQARELEAAIRAEIRYRTVQYLEQLGLQGWVDAADAVD